MMKRLLTYGLLLLTILASHFVVSACQDDLPETTEVMVTFTTRAISGGSASTAPEIEQMHDLRVIMLRSDGTIVGKGQYTPEGDFNPSSVRFTFSTTIPNPEGEDFTFFVIANDETLPWEDLSVGQTLLEPAITALKESTVDTDINSYPIPQTDYWTVHVPQSNYKIDDRTLQFAGSKISVVFNNMTKEVQSLSNIHITGITPNTRGYLFKQENRDDYIDSKLMDNGNAVSTISFGDLSLDAPNTNDKTETVYDIDSIPYYTYPLAASNFDSPKLYATWGDDTRELDLSGITSLARNEHLRIFITLTPAGDITVNYTIAPWEETPTNIGDKAPTTPDNDNEYNTKDWGASNDIEIGGDEDDPWSNLGGEIIAGGSDIFDNWNDVTGLKDNSYLQIPLEDDYLVVGNKLAIEFKTTYTSYTSECYAYLQTHHEQTILAGPISYDITKKYVIVMTFNADNISKIKGEGGLVLKADSNNNVDILRMAIVEPD